ncbi:uncharacterized protein LOC108110725 [Drosophila eugracilis]|uniref:uncharacterized protein LOC108110725 n=1 Tax=Drosophila eugracilis TaxID=29029 RepID=UPI001BDAA31D|nr:uncharacterized protein LOC108110725 [Drosophila eugracilis]
MSSGLGTPIVSIFDMMVERHLKLRRESALKEATISRRTREERIVGEVKKPNIKSKPISQHTPRNESPCPANAITASHLTKKQTFLKVLPPSKKEEIKKLVEKISKGPGRSNPVAHKEPKSSKKTSAKSSKMVLSPHRKKRTGGQTSFRSKQKSSCTRIKRLPLSPVRVQPGQRQVTLPPKSTKKNTKISTSNLSIDAEVLRLKRWRF